MPRTRRLTALLVSFFLAHAMWAGSGFVCGMPAMGHTVMTGMDMSSADMAGMDMSGMHMSATPGQRSSSDQGGAPKHDHAPCELPWAPNGCQSLSPCAPLALASNAEQPRVPDNVPLSVAPLTVLTPPSQARPPELPPPRA